MNKFLTSHYFHGTHQLIIDLHHKQQLMKGSIPEQSDIAVEFLE